MYQLMTRRMETISPQRAEALLTMNTLEYQRPINDTHVNMLKQKMNEGLFRVGNIAIAENGRGGHVLINGQHQCMAAIATNSDFQALAEYYKCPTKKDVSLLYRQYDNNMSSRSKHDLLAVEVNALGLEWTNANKVATLLTSAHFWGQNKTYGDMHAEALKKLIPEGDFLNDILNEHHMKLCRHLCRRSVVYAMLQTWYKNKSDAYHFWRQVRDGEMLTRHDPAWHLNRFLVEIKIDPRKGGAVASQHEIVARCAKAWNNYRQNKKMKRLPYYANQPIPKFM